MAPAGVTSTHLNTSLFSIFLVAVACCVAACGMLVYVSRRRAKIAVYEQKIEKEQEELREVKQLAAETRLVPPHETGHPKTQDLESASSKDVQAALALDVLMAEDAASGVMVPETKDAFLPERLHDPDDTIYISPYSTSSAI